MGKDPICYEKLDKKTNKMNFTLEELEIIKDALIIALNGDNLDNQEGAIKILDRIDEEMELD